MNAIVRYLFASGICFAAFSALGSYVSSGPPGPLDLAARALRGEATQLALFLTALGYWYVIVQLSAIVGTGTIVSRGRIWIAAGIFVSQILSQTAVAACKPHLAPWCDGKPTPKATQRRRKRRFRERSYRSPRLCEKSPRWEAGSGAASVHHCARNADLVPHFDSPVIAPNSEARPYQPVRCTLMPPNKAGNSLAYAPHQSVEFPVLHTKNVA
jgi:hypothetical protein